MCQSPETRLVTDFTRQPQTIALSRNYCWIPNLIQTFFQVPSYHFFFHLPREIMFDLPESENLSKPHLLMKDFAE